MDAADPSRSRRFDLSAIAIIAFLAVPMCFATWKWAESASRSRCLREFQGRGAVAGLDTGLGTGVEERSTDWPLRNVQQIASIGLTDGRFSDDDVRHLRRAFPGVYIFHGGPATAIDYRSYRSDLPKVMLPEDYSTAHLPP